MNKLFLTAISLFITTSGLSFNASVQSFEYWRITGIPKKIADLNPSNVNRKSILVNGVQLNDISSRWRVQAPHGQDITKCIDNSSKECKTRDYLMFRKKKSENGEIVRAYEELDPNVPMVTVNFEYNFPTGATLRILDFNEEEIAQTKIEKGSDSVSWSRKLPEGTDFAIISLELDTSRGTIATLTDLMIIGSECLLDTVTLTCTNGDYFEEVVKESSMTGSWNLKSGFDFILDVQQSGSSFSGTLDVVGYPEIDRVEGTISGAEVVFTRYIAARNNRTQIWKGKLSADGSTLRGSWSGEGGGASFSGERN